MLKILHIASISEDPFNGVCVAVPQHVQYQNIFAETALLNITNEPIPVVTTQLRYDSNASLDKLCGSFGRPDIIVFHEAYRVPYLKISQQACRLGIPYVIIPHGELSEWAQKKKRLKKTIGNIVLFNRFIERSLAVQCLSRTELNGTHFKCKKIIATNGVDLPESYKKSFSKDGVDFIYVGRLDVYHKGLDMMIDAFAAQSDLMRATHSHLNIYGPDFKGRFNNIASMIKKRNAADFILLHHEVIGDEKQHTLLGSDVFVQTSRFEGLPLGILEALAHGLPCVVTEGTGLTEEVQEFDAGWISQNNVTSIAKAIGEVITDRCMLPSKSQRARTLVGCSFTWYACSKRAISVYESLLRSVSVQSKAR